jgi:Family of unknown function (DUF6455)
MTPQPQTSEAHGAFAAIARWIDRYRDMFDPDRQFAACTPEDVQAIAHDLAMTPDELRTLTRKGPDGARLLYKMLSALGADPQKLSKNDPMAMRDLQRLCVSCGYKRQCEHDLSEGQAAQTYHDYCPNAYTLDLLFQHTPEDEVVADIKAAAEKA